MFGAKQRSYWFVAIAITLLMILGGCGSQPTSAPEPTQASAPADTPAAAGAPTDTAVPAEAPAKEPITIVFSNIAETGTLDPAIAFSSDGLEFVRNVYEGLLDYAPGTTDLRPLLATEWTVSEDGLVYTFKLRDDVVYHDGAKFNAEAAKIGLDRLLGVNQGPASMMTSIDTIEATGEYELKITLKQPNVYFLGVLPKLPLVSPQAIEDHKTADDPWAQDWFATNGSGTGPYKFESWTKGNQIVLVKNTDYWQPWQEYTADRVILRVDADIATALLLLEQGQIDMMGAVGPDDSIAAESMQGVKLIKQPMFQVSILPLNMSKGPLADLKVRQAIKYAFDYAAFIDFFQGLGEVPTGPLPSNAAGVDPSLQPAQQDLEKAKQLLVEAGYPGGGFKLQYLGLKGLSYEEFAGTLLQDGLSKIGIELEQILVPWPQMPPMMADEANAPDISYLNNSMFTFDPTDILRTSYYSTNVASNGNYNWSYYRNPEVDAWLDQVVTIQDEQERTQLLYKIQEQIVNDVPALYVVQPTLAQPVREEIQGAIYETLDYNYLVRFFYVQKMPK